MQRLVDQVAIVTGGARGIGGATARRLAEEGAPRRPNALCGRASRRSGKEARVVLGRLPTLVGRSLVGVVFGTALIYASVVTTLTMTARACDAMCTSLLQKRAAFEEQAVAELHRCEHALQSPCSPTDAGVAYDGATSANERLVAYRLAHRDEAATITELARKKHQSKLPR